MIALSMAIINIIQGRLVYKAATNGQKGVYFAIFIYLILFLLVLIDNLLYDLSLSDCFYYNRLVLNRIFFVFMSSITLYRYTGSRFTLLLKLFER